MAQRDAVANLHEEILYLLPSKDLLNFKRVCKDWNELISSERFIQKHLHRSNAGSLIFTLSRSGINVFDDKKICRRISYPPRFSVHNTKIAGSCDGLVCLVRLRSKEFAIINPSTGKFDVGITDGIKFNPDHWFWFGKHPSGEYSIIGIQRESRLIRVYKYCSSRILSLHDFSIVALDADRISSRPKARTFGEGRNPFIYNISVKDAKPILFHGGLHWPGYRANRHDPRIVVLAYDIQKKEFVEISTPFDLEPCMEVRLGVVDGCLFAVIRTWRRVEMWIMKEYGVEESWTKYADIEGFEEKYSLFPMGFLPDGDLVFDVDYTEIVKYSFSDKKGRVVLVYGDGDFDKIIVIRSAVLCADSLVSPALIWGK